MDPQDRTNVEGAINAFREGKMVMVMDRLDRENECDFMISARGCTKQDMAFMIRYSTGIVCVVTDKKRLDTFGLHVATPNNTDSNGTNFHVATDHIPTTTTGVSAQDRVNTLKAFMDLNNRAEDFSKPGHMFPLCARPGGLTERDGHTESAYDLCRLAGVETVAGIAEMMDDEGEMMRLEDCKAFARDHQIPLITTVSLKEYATQYSDIYNTHPDEVTNTTTIVEDNRPPPIEMLSSCRVPLHHLRYTSHCDLRVYRGCSDPSLEIVTLIKGNVDGESDVPVRVHSECFTGDVLRSMKCDCGDQLLDFLVTLDEEERAVLLYIRGHEGRGIGLANKIKAYNLQDEDGLDTVESNLKLGYAPDCRDFADARRALKHLGIRSVMLYTNNPAKVAALGELVSEVRAVPARPNRNNIDYLRTKQVKFNHLTVLRSPRYGSDSGELSPVTTAGEDESGYFYNELMD
ncbi:GTP cyclohydrolase II [Perkinsus olseni]|uniref:GTP cyclohydrolase II n=1 Tax=Perkinsus olseni TaxID=32597 RepID=A0A7J6RS54_PEROL|nr:GTP cyclohydrolase II [Perkinsus olseni]KAF4723215.1 GTP cyclohydrolase II [Perkinsus olseni]